MRDEDGGLAGRAATTGSRLRPWNSRVRAALAQHAEDVGDRGRHVEQVHQPRDALPRRALARREADDERDVDALLVELHVVADPAVLDQGLAVVRRHDHDGAVEQPLRLERAAQRADLLVGEGQVAVVEAHEVGALLVASAAAGPGSPP